MLFALVLGSDNRFFGKFQQLAGAFDLCAEALDLDTNLLQGQLSFHASGTLSTAPFLHPQPTRSIHGNESGKGMKTV